MSQYPEPTREAGRALAGDVRLGCEPQHGVHRSVPMLEFALQPTQGCPTR